MHIYLHIACISLFVRAMIFGTMTANPPLVSDKSLITKDGKKSDVVVMDFAKAFNKAFTPGYSTNYTCTE